MLCVFAANNGAALRSVSALRWAQEEAELPRQNVRERSRVVRRSVCDRLSDDVAVGVPRL
jgi:hypothetical protein